MPYRRATTRRRRTPMRRRRGRTGRARRTTGQRYFKHKMTILVPVKSEENQGNVRASFSLQNTTDTTTGQVAGFDKSPRWALTYRNYEQYAVTGLKLKWIPTNARGGVSQSLKTDPVTGLLGSKIFQSQLGSQFLYYDTDTYNASQYTLDQVAAMDRNWCLTPDRPWKKFFSAKGLSRMQNVQWQDTATYVPNNRNQLTNASVSIIQPFSGQGEGQNTTFGYIKATWYVTFRGQAYL